MSIAAAAAVNAVNAGGGGGAETPYGLKGFIFSSFTFLSFAAWIFFKSRLARRVGRVLLTRGGGRTLGGGGGDVALESGAAAGGAAAGGGEGDRMPISATARDDDCPICFEKPENIMCYTSCGHVFCESCVLSHWRNRHYPNRCLCPICRGAISTLFPMNAAGNVSRQMAEYNETVGGGGGGGGGGAAGAAGGAGGGGSDMIIRADLNPCGRVVMACGDCMRFVCESPFLLRSCAEIFLRQPRVGIALLFYLGRSFTFVFSLLATSFYCYFPVDLLPESTLGYFGLIDDGTHTHTQTHSQHQHTQTNTYTHAHTHTHTHTHTQTGFVQVLLLLLFLSLFRRFVLQTPTSSRQA